MLNIEGNSISHVKYLCAARETWGMFDDDADRLIDVVFISLEGGGELEVQSSQYGELRDFAIEVIWNESETKSLQQSGSRAQVFRDVSTLTSWKSFVGDSLIGAEIWWESISGSPPTSEPFAMLTESTPRELVLKFKSGREVFIISSSRNPFDDDQWLRDDMVTVVYSQVIAKRMGLGAHGGEEHSRRSTPLEAHYSGFR